MHEFGEEHAALLGGRVVAEHAVALVLEAGEGLGRVVVAFLFAVAEEASVLFALVAPAHLAAAIEGTHAAARDHDVELTLFHVVADVCGHDDELLALDCAQVVVACVLALAGKGQLVALAAGTAVSTRDCREGEAHIGTAVDGERNLAQAGRLVAARTDASAAADNVLALGVAGLAGVAAGIFRPGAVGCTAVPVAGCPAGTGSATALHLDVRASACRSDRRTALRRAARGFRLAAAGLGCCGTCGGGADIRAGFGAGHELAGTRFDDRVGFLGELVARLQDREVEDVFDLGEFGNAVGRDNRVGLEVEESDDRSVGILHEADGTAVFGEVDEVVAGFVHQVEGRAGNGVHCGVLFEQGEARHVHAVVEHVAREVGDDAHGGTLDELDGGDDVAFGVGDAPVKVDDVVLVCGKKPCRRCYCIFGSLRASRGFIGTVPGDHDCARGEQGFQKCMFHNFLITLITPQTKIL